MPRSNHKAAFTLVEVLVVVAILAVLAGLVLGAVPAALGQADRADALAKTRNMGTAVLQYAFEHQLVFPPLFPGQVLEFEQGRRGRIVTECASYLGIENQPGKYLVRSLLPRAYQRVSEPTDPNAMRVWVMNSSIMHNGNELRPFGTLGAPGAPPTNAGSLYQIPDTSTWMMSTADRQQSNVATASWRANAPPLPPLGNQRAIFRFDGSAGMEKIP